MIVRYLDSKISVGQKNVRLENYPLDWIEGFVDHSIDEISRKLFGIPYDKLEHWEFITKNQSVIKNTSDLRTVHYRRRNYKLNHVTGDGTIAALPGKKSRFWRGIYYPDLGINGRLGGAKKNKPGNGRHPRFLEYHTSSGKIKKDLISTDMTASLIEAEINLVFHFTLEVPPAKITLEHLERNGIKLVYNLGGRKGGQPLPQTLFGIGTRSKLGSIWYNYPEPYFNERHAPGESFELDTEVALANSHSAVIAILQQDEPFYTNIFKQRYNLIKTLTTKPVFCTYNWGDYYNNSSLRYKLFRSQRIRPIAHVTDIYSNDLYTFTPERKNFKEFGRPDSNIWRLVDRHRAEILELKNELGDFDKPVWMTLQGYGVASKSKPNFPLVPDPDYMFAQIWGAVCLGATGIAIYLMHTASSDATNFNRRAKDKRASLIHGISPMGPHQDTWSAMAKAYKLINQYEEILLGETIVVEICKDGHVITLLKEYMGEFYIFALNCFRDIFDIDFIFDVLPGKNWKYKNTRTKNVLLSTTGVEKIRFQPFELKIFSVQNVLS